MNNKPTVAIAVIALVIAIIGCYLPVSQAVSDQHVGGVTNYDEVDATAIKIGGSSGSRVGPMIMTSCSLIFSNGGYTVAATTSTPVDCAVTGIVPGDVVVANFGSTSPVVNGGWLVTQANASSTAGFVTLHIQNLTGTANLIPGPGTASSTNVVIFHPVTSVPGL